MRTKSVKANCPDKEAFLNDVMNGMTVIELSKKYNVCHSIISRWRVELGIAKDTNIFDRINKEQFIVDCNTMKTKDLSIKYKVNRNCITAWKRKLGIKVNEPLSKTHEQFVNEVIAKHGDSFTVLDSYINSYTKIRFKHNNCGYIFKARPSAFLENVGCPKCSFMAYHKRKIQKHKTKFNNIANNMRKDGYVFLSEYAGIRKPIEIIHLTCGHRYITKPETILKGHGCPKCGHLKTGQSVRIPHDVFKKEFKKILGNEYELLDKYAGIEKKISILHKECGEIYQTTPKQILSIGSRCPYCKTKVISNGEYRIEQYLKSNNIEFQKQYKIPRCKNKKLLKFDFAIFSHNKLIALIEYDGMQHFKPIKYYGGESTYKLILARDKIKNDYCKKRKIYLIRIPYFEFKNIESILNERLSEIPTSIQLSILSLL